MILGGRLCEQSAIALEGRCHNTPRRKEAGWGRGFLALFGAG